MSSELPSVCCLLHNTALADVDELSKAPLSPSGSSRLPPEAKPDVVMTQARLLRKVTPEDVSTLLDEDKELLAWLAQRGFYDMVALQYM
eukprot:20399-Heterococcus_DN1.PRE.2